MRKTTAAFYVILTMIITATGTVFGMRYLEERIPVLADNPQMAGMEKIEQIYQLILDEYVEPVDGEMLIEGAIEGMLEKLDDPYSVYMNAEQSRHFKETLDSSFEGIGAEIGEEDGKIIVIAPFKNSPAERAGLQPYDQIIKVNGEDVTGENIYEVSERIRGEKGTKVTLEIVREGVSQPIKLEITRDEIPIETVFSTILDYEGKSIGIVEITSFSRQTGKDFATQLRELEEQGIEGLIIDVRGNPGGLLSSVHEVAGLLITKEKPIVQIEYRNGKREQIFSRLKKRKPYPIAVLIDRGSASAAEILAAALYEGEGYPTIGETTFGKGTVQQQIELPDQSQVKLTTYKWLTPDGNWLHKKGLEPKIPVKQAELFQIHPLSTDEPLRRNMNNEEIKQLQNMLNSLGYQTARTDGYFDDSTEQALRRFQKEQGVPETGIYDEKTARSLADVLRYEKQKPENDRQLMMALKYFHYILSH